MTRQRPSGIALVAIWFFLSGLFNALSGAGVAFALAGIFGWLGLASEMLGGTGLQSIQLMYTLLGLVLVATGIGMLILGWGLLEGREWARTWGMVASGISALSKLIIAVLPIIVGGGLLMGPMLAFIVPALLDLLALFYLLSEEARAYCSEYAPIPGQWSPIQETVPAARTAVPISDAQPPAPLQPPVLPRTELMAQPVRAAAWLVARSPGRAGRQFPLQAARNTIGRDGSRCQVVLDDSTVSSEHAAIVFERGRFVLYDLASTNGTHINDQRIQRQMLYDGDEIRLGSKVLVFKKV